MYDIDLNKKPKSGFEFLLSLIISSARDIAFVISRKLFLFFLAILTVILISSCQWHIFLRVGYSNLPFMSAVNFMTIVGKVIAAFPLIFSSHRLLFPEMTAARKAKTNLLLNAWVYLGISIMLFTMNDIGFIFCVLGDSGHRIGLLLTFATSIITCILWVRIITIFPALAVGGDSINFVSAVKSIKGRFSQTVFVLGFPIFLLRYGFRTTLYFLLMLLVRRYGGRADFQFLSQDVWGASSGVVFVLVWMLVAVVGSRLYHDGLGRNWAAEIERDPEEADLIYNPRARKT